MDKVCGGVKVERVAVVFGGVDADGGEADEGVPDLRVIWSLCGEGESTDPLVCFVKGECTFRGPQKLPFRTGRVLITKEVGSVAARKVSKDQISPVEVLLPLAEELSDLVLVFLLVVTPNGSSSGLWFVSCLVTRRLSPSLLLPCDVVMESAVCFHALSLKDAGREVAAMAEDNNDHFDVIEQLNGAPCVLFGFRSVSLKDRKVPSQCENLWGVSPGW